MNLWLLGGRVGRGEVRDFGIDMYTLLCLKQITNKDLLYSTGNPAQYYVTTIMEKNMKKNVYMCITESLCCRAEINIVNQLYFNKLHF